MVAEATDLEFVATDSESEALLLENNWIKKRKPRYNVLLRDDKTYPYLKLTREEYRGSPSPPHPGGWRRLFRPFLPGGLARKAIKLVQKLFGVRVCHIPIDGTLPRPLPLLRHAPLPGPCVAGLNHQGGLRPGGAPGQALPRREERVAGQGPQAADVGGAEATDYEKAAQLRDTLGRSRRPASGASSPRSPERTSTSSASASPGETGGGWRSSSCAVARCSIAGAVLGGGGRDLPRGAPLRDPPPVLRPHDLHPQGESTYRRRSRGRRRCSTGCRARRGKRVYVRLPSRGPKAERVALASTTPSSPTTAASGPTPSSRPAPSLWSATWSSPSRPRRIEGFRHLPLPGRRDRGLARRLGGGEDAQGRVPELQHQDRRGDAGRLRLDERGGRTALPAAFGRGRACPT